MSRAPGVLALVLALAVAGCGGADATPPDPAAPSPAASPPVASAPPEATAPPTSPGPAAAPPRVDENADPTRLSPEDTLEAWVTAQEEGDFGWAMTFLVESRQAEWEQAAEEMSTDDLIQSGLQFRDEDYQLEFTDSKLAVFWSSEAHLYLVMTREGDRWKVDPGQTDEMNQHATSH